MKNKLKTAFWALLTFFGSIETFGCVCNDLDFKRMLKTSDFVIVGRPTTNIHPDSTAVRLLNNEGYGSEVYFKVEKVLKGDIKQDILIINQIGHGSCTLGVKLGDRYLVFGHIKSYALPPIGDFNPIVEIDSVTGKKEIVYVPSDNTSIVGDYIKTLNNKFDIVHTSSCGLFNERTKFYRQTRKWIKRARTINQV